MIASILTLLVGLVLAGYWLWLMHLSRRRYWNAVLNPDPRELVRRAITAFGDMRDAFALMRPAIERANLAFTEFGRQMAVVSNKTAEALGQVATNHTTDETILGIPVIPDERVPEGKIYVIDTSKIFKPPDPPEH